jgi:hypothetical protein
MDFPERAGSKGAVEPIESGEVVEMRPTEILRVCPNCLVSNTSANQFCTACGTQLPQTDAVSNTNAAVQPADAEFAWPASASAISVSPPVPRSAFESEPAGRRLGGRLLVVAIAALVAALAGFAIFAALWQMERNHASRLHGALTQSRLDLASTKAKLAATQAKLSSATSLSDKRRAVLLHAQDVVAKVDPLLSAVDNIQGKAGNLASQGSAMTGDAETFISTVADLVNYLVNSSGGYVDYTFVGQQIDTANSELSTLRHDESAFSSGDSSYGGASKSFGVKADAFSASVRALQKQLSAVTSK